MKHKHAELMAMYAQDAMETDSPWERWERINKNDKFSIWEQCAQSPAWYREVEYRRKPRTININGHEVPEPVREALNLSTEYFTIDTWNSKIVESYTWQGDETDLQLLKRGIIHLAREAAEAHAKALLSFTEKQP